MAAVNAIEVANGECDRVRRESGKTSNNVHAGFTWKATKAMKNFDSNVSTAGRSSAVSGRLVPRPISLRTCREPSPRDERAKRTAAIAWAMARMSDKAIGDADRLEHSKTYGARY